MSKVRENKRDRTVPLRASLKLQLKRDYYAKKANKVVERFRTNIAINLNI